MTSDAFRSYGASLVYLTAAACYVAAVLPGPLWLMAILVVPLTAILIQLPLYALGFLLGDGVHLRTQSIMLVLMMLASSIYFAFQPGWIHYVARTMLVLLMVSVPDLLPVRRLILVAAVASPVLLFMLWHWSPAGAIGIVALSHLLVLFPTLTPNSQWLGPVITRFKTGDRELWLTIDDGPTADTTALLDLLDAKQVRATFFVKGRNADEESLRAIRERGHTIGNHSWSHPSGTFWCLGPGAIGREIDRGVPSRFFRAPVGMKNPFVHPALRKRDMRLVGWSVRGFDATRSDVDRIAVRIAERLEPGAIVVVHEGREWSVRCIERVIDEAQSRGYRFVIPEEAALVT